MVIEAVAGAVVEADGLGAVVVSMSVIDAGLQSVE